MTGISIGGINVPNISVGDTPIAKVSVGDALVWPSGPVAPASYVVFVGSVLDFPIPVGVTRIGVCAIGSGGNGLNRTTAQGGVGSGGGGGGMAWANFDVTAGETFNITVGAQGQVVTFADMDFTTLLTVPTGANATATATGALGSTGSVFAGSFFAGRNLVSGVASGGNGGQGSATASNAAGGGGGAAGYTGSGGVGGTNAVPTGAVGSGGGAGGGGAGTGSSPKRGGRGGSTVPWGQASSGAGGAGAANGQDGGWGSLDGVPASEEVYGAGSAGGGGLNQAIGINGTGGVLVIRMNGPDYPTYMPAMTDNVTRLPAGFVSALPRGPEDTP